MSKIGPVFFFGERLVIFEKLWVLIFSKINDGMFTDRSDFTKVKAINLSGWATYSLFDPLNDVIFMFYANISFKFHVFGIGIFPKQIRYQ